MQQHLAAEQRLPGHVQQLDDAFPALGGFLLRRGPAVEAKGEIRSAAAKVEDPEGQAALVGFQPAVRQDARGIGHRLVRTDMHAQRRTGAPGLLLRQTGGQAALQPAPETLHDALPCRRIKGDRKGKIVFVMDAPVLSVLAVDGQTEVKGIDLQRVEGWRLIRGTFPRGGGRKQKGRAALIPQADVRAARMAPRPGFDVRQAAVDGSGIWGGKDLFPRLMRAFEGLPCHLRPPFLRPPGRVKGCRIHEFQCRGVLEMPGTGSLPPVPNAHAQETLAAPFAQGDHRGAGAEVDADRKILHVAQGIAGHEAALNGHDLRCGLGSGGPEIPVPAQRIAQDALVKGRVAGAQAVGMQQVPDRAFATCPQKAYQLPEQERAAATVPPGAGLLFPQFRLEEEGGREQGFDGLPVPFVYFQAGLEQEIPFRRPDWFRWQRLHQLAERRIIFRRCFCFAARQQFDFPYGLIGNDRIR